jgi:coenzyme Q-binding protein COQ10
MAHVERVVTIQAPLHRVFSVVTDYARYPEFLPEMENVEIVSYAQDKMVVRFDVDVIIRTSYTVRLHHNRPTHVQWELAESKHLTKNDGFWRFEELSATQTRAVYGLDIELLGVIPRSVRDRLAGPTLDQSLRRFIDRAEKDNVVNLAHER